MSLAFLLTIIMTNTVSAKGDINSDLPNSKEFTETIANASMEMEVETETLTNNELESCHEQETYNDFETGDSDQISSSATVSMQGQRSDVLPMSTQITTTGYIPDGVYAIRNVANTNFWVDVQNDSNTSGAYIQQTLYSSNPADTFTRPALFKISRIENTDRYVIRLMINNTLSFFGHANADVKTVSVSSKDSGVLLKNQFHITYDAGGYVIKPSHSTSYGLSAKNTTSSGENAYPYSQLTFSSLNTAGDLARWQLFQYTGATKSGISMPISPTNWNYGGKIGTEYSIKLITWTTQLGANTPYLTVHSNYTEMADYSWNSSSNTLTITPLKEGPIRLSPSIRYDETTSTYVSFYTVYSIAPQIDGDTAYIQNGATGKYIDLEQINYAPSGIVQQYSFATGTQQQWIFEVAYGGFFYIKSVQSGKYIGLEQSNTTSVKHFDTKNDYTLWRFSQTTSGKYTIACKATESTGYVLSVPQSTSGNGADLTMLMYVDDTNYRDEWKIGVFVTSLRINLFADAAYRNRFENYSSKLSSSMSAIREKYLFDFQILIKYSSVNSISSWGDYCDNLTGGDYSDVCIHYGTACANSSFSSTGNANQTLHHKNLYNILFRIPFPDITNSMSAVFIGHDTCRINSEGQHDGSFNGIAWPSYGFMAVTNFGSVLSERKSILHEIGHWYQVEDHYGAGGKTTEQMGSGYSKYCIYGEEREDETVLNNMTICDGCYATIKANATLYNHQ